MPINKHRVIRAITTASWALAVSGGPLVGALAGAFIGAFLSPPGSRPDGMVEWAFFGALVMLAPQIWMEYKRRTYDPTYAFTFDERFNDMKEVRYKAAKIIEGHFGGLGKITEAYAEIDDVLDFFDDLGFFVRGHQISPEMAHQFFYEWIEGYYENAAPYMTAMQNKTASKWEHIHQLYTS